MVYNEGLHNPSWFMRGGTTHHGLQWGLAQPIMVYNDGLYNPSWLSSKRSKTHCITHIVYTQQQKGYLALMRQCPELVHYMLPAALEYHLGEWNGLFVYRPAREGRSYEHFGGYKTINWIPLLHAHLGDVWVKGLSK